MTAPQDEEGFTKMQNKAHRLREKAASGKVVNPWKKKIAE
jgi:hypothetical protein